MNAYVIVWREPPSTRLKTYVDPETLAPYSYPLEDLSPAPAPDEILLEADAVEAWLASDDPHPVVILEELAVSNLGWHPIPAP